MFHPAGRVHGDQRTGLHLQPILVDTRQSTQGIQSHDISRQPSEQDIRLPFIVHIRSVVIASSGIAKHCTHAQLCKSLELNSRKRMR